jgi:hypothetical protein
MTTATYFPKSLLSVDTNAKTVKGQTLGFLTGILYLAPAAQSGQQFCPMARIAGCEAACLYTAGRGAMSSVQVARMNRSQLFIQQRDWFMGQLVQDITKLVRRAARLGLTPLVRLNGTSDIRWENIACADGRTLMETFPEVQFYDYTKLANRRDLPANYDLTFSWSGVEAYRPYALRAAANGMRIAVVFRDAASIPATFEGMECVGGDDSDVRHLDPQGVVVALYAKGQAKRDQSGFVIDTPRRIIPIMAA